MAPKVKIDPTTQYLNKRKEKPDYVRSLLEPTDTPPNRHPVPRLCLSSFSKPLPFSYEGYARTISESSLNDHAFFLDTCFVRKEAPQEFWDAIFKRTICITDWIDFELGQCPWKSNPSKNLCFHARYMKAKEIGDDGIQFLLKPDSDSPIDIAIRHYAGLLGLRKRIFQIIRDQLESQSDKSPSEDEVHARVQAIVKERGMQIATKGNKNASKSNSMADEYLIVQAFAYALSTGRDVTVLTWDRDLSEQFYKTQYLLDTHYRSMLLADSFVQQPLNFLKASDLRLKLPGFDSLDLYRIPAGMDQRVLSNDCKFVNVRVDRIVESGKDLVYTSIQFTAEKEMARVLTTKGETNGLNTSALGGRNLHRCVHPYLMSQLGNYIAITEDRFVVDGELRYTELDTVMVLTPCESGAAVKSIELSKDLPSLDVQRQAMEISSFRLPKRLTPTFSREFVRTNQSAVALALEIMEPWNRFLVSSELLPDLPAELLRALNTHDCGVLPAHLSIARQVGLEAEPIGKISADDGGRVFDYYLALLSHRKMFGEVRRRALAKRTGNRVSMKQIHRDVISHCDPGCWLRTVDYLNRSGDTGVFDDETIVVDAFFKAVCNGRETVIITRRPELVDQFWTMAQTLEGHFRAWALSKSQTEFFRAQKNSGPDFRGLFSSNPVLCSFASSVVHSAIPKHSLEIGIQVWLLDGDLGDPFKVYPVGFPVEPAMTELFRCKDENDFRSAVGLDGRNVYFQWANTEERGLIAQCWLGEDKMVKIGSDDFPSDDRLSLSITEVPAFDLTLTTAQDRYIPFPWAKVEQMKKLRDDRKRKRKRVTKRKPG